MHCEGAFGEVVGFTHGLTGFLSGPEKGALDSRIRLQAGRLHFEAFQLLVKSVPDVPGKTPPLQTASDCSNKTFLRHR